MVTAAPPRAPDALFDWAEATPVPAAPRLQDTPPGYLEGIARGTRYVPVFSDGKNWFTKGLSDAGNWISDEIAKQLKDLAHKPFIAGTTIPLGDKGVALNLDGKLQILREDQIPAADPKKLAILELKAQHPGAVPLWIEVGTGAGLGFNPSHLIPLGTSGAYVRFGLQSGAGAHIVMQRLVFVDKNDPSRLTPEDASGNRLQLSPFSAADMAKIEQGASFKIIGDANLRVDGAIGFGAEVPALSDLVRVGASVEAGAYAALTGRFEISAEKVEKTRTRVTVSALGTASAGVQLKAFAGVQVNADRVGSLMRGFVDYVANGGDPKAFENQLSNEEERKMLGDASGYMRLLVKNLAEGAGRAAVDTLITKYATAYAEARAGVDLSARFKTSVDFELDGTYEVTLTRADMVPADMRGGVAADKPLKIQNGKLARLAYDMALRGDLRLVQQLALIRNSGVRIVETETGTEKKTTVSAKVNAPFIEYENTTTKTDSVTNRYTPELGRSRSAVAEFSQRYHGVFGRTHEDSATLRVHSPDGALDSLEFAGSDENFSADFVVQNQAEPWTSYEEMAQLTTVLDVLSAGRLSKRTAEALKSGRYRGDSAAADLNPIHLLFQKPREFGRSVVHLHIWLGEPGLRAVLESDLTREGLLARFGRVALDVSDARLLTDELLQLRDRAKAAKTPAQEEKLAQAIRDLLQRARKRMPVYAALASLVPESQRAVEMRLSSMVPGRPPIRFTFIQDGRTSEILRVAGFAKMALDQYLRYQTMLDPETRLRTGALLGEVNSILNSPSPDIYKLAVAERKLREELARLDERQAEMQQRLVADIGAARSFIAGLPDSKTIEAVLPSQAGTELVVLRMNALRAVNADPPDVAYLRTIVKQLVANMPKYRAIAEVSPLLASTATMANAIAADAPTLVEQAQEAAALCRKQIEVGGKGDEYQASLARLRAVHQGLTARTGWLADIGGLVETPAPAALPETSPKSLAEQRDEAAKKYQALAGNPDVAAFSYFERAGVVPPSYMGTPYQSAGEGVVTGAMVTEADLMMAASRPSSILQPPKLSAENVKKLVDAAKAKDGKTFLDLATKLQFQPGEWTEDPRRCVVEALVKRLSDQDFASLVQYLPQSRADSLRRLRADSVDTARVDKTIAGSPILRDDLTFLIALVKRDPKQMSFALDNLGYGALADRLYLGNVSRLDAAMQELTGDELLALCKSMKGDDKKRLYQLIATSDLTPQRRAKLAGAIVDDTFFFKTEENLVEALVTGMNAADLRIFFDQLHTDKKLEKFLSAGSIWQILLTILTFGLARLFFHDNAAARRVVAGLGYTEDHLNVEYGAKKRAANAVERSVSDALTKSVLDTTPMDPLLRHSLQLLHDILGEVKYYDFAALPKEGKDLLVAMAKGAGKQVLRRMADIAIAQKGSPEDMIAEYKRFFAGLSPQAIAATFEKGEVDSTTSVIMKALADGAIAGVIEEAASGKNKFINTKLVLGIVESMNELDKPLTFRKGGSDVHVDQAGYDGLIEKWEFFKGYMGLDYSRVRVIYGGLAKAAGAVTFADTISIAPGRAPIKDHKILLDDGFQQVIAFHESVHVVQQQMYGESVNAFIDQGIKMASSGDRNGAYTVTEEMLDKATSVHAFQEDWEQQAELLEQTLRLLWTRSKTAGGAYESYPGDGLSINVGGATIRITPERWQKLVGFVKEFGQSARSAGVGGPLVIKKIQPLHVYDH